MPDKKSPMKKSPGKASNKESPKPKNPAGDTLEEEVLRRGVDQMHGFYPRVWVSLGQKIQVKDYEPVDIQFGYSLDLRPGDNQNDVVEGMIKFVRAKIKPLIMEAQDAKKKFTNLKNK